MTRTKQERTEIIAKVRDIKLKHLLTWTAKDWEKEYGYLKDEIQIWDLIQEHCAHRWPEVDIDRIMESYALFGPEHAKENGLHSILQCGKRNITGAKLSEKCGNNIALKSLMRYLLGMVGKEAVDKSLSVGKWKKALSTMEKVDPAVTLLQFVSADSSSPKFMLKYGTTPSDESSDSLTEDSIRNLELIMGGLKGGDYLSHFTPMRDKRFSDMLAILRDGCVRMDVINYVAGCLKDIRLGASSIAMSQANAEFMDDYVGLGLPPISWWKDDFMNDWEIRDMGSSMLMTRFNRRNKTFNRFVCIVTRDVDGSLLAYIEKPEMAQRLFDREDPDDTVAYTILNIKDPDGRYLVDVGNPNIKTAYMRFSIQTTHKTMRGFLGTEELTRQYCDLSDKYVGCKPSGDCDFPTSQKEATYNSSYIYLPYEEETSHTKNGVELCATKSWLRIPCGQSYEMLHEGERCDLIGIRTAELPLLRTVKGRDGSTRNILLFALKNIIVDVTDALHPKVGDVMPYGIMLVDSPTAAYTSTTWSRSSIVEAHVEGRDETGRMVAKVTYSITSCKRKGYDTETTEVVVREYVREPRTGGRKEV